GNYGSATRSLAPSINPNIGFSTGWDQFDPYYLSIDSFRYYSQDVPVVKIKYSQANQEDTYLTLQFGRSFAKGWSLSLAYNRINQGDRIAYHFENQRQKNTALGLGIWHNSPNGKYDAFYNYISNTAISEDNGGVSDPDSIGVILTPNSVVPVFITQGMTSHKHRSFTTKQIIHLISDTTEIGIDLWMKGQFTTGLFKYVDPEPSGSLDYYGDFLVDERGIRQFTNLNEYQFSGGFSLPWRVAHSTIQSSLRYRSINLQQEPIQRTINELYLDASGSFQLVEPLELKGQMSLGLGNANGAFLFKAEGSLNTGILGKLKGYWSIATRNPYMVESSLYVNKQIIYNVDLENPFTTEFGVGWNWEKQNLNANIRWLIFDNYIYFDTAHMPTQIGESFSLRRFSLSKDFDFKWIGLKGNVIWQPDVREEVAIPELIYTAGLYGRVKVFKRKLTVMPGLDINYHDGYNGISYFPVNGRFHITNDMDIPDYFRIDAAIGIHINFLKIFVRIEDVAGFWKDRVLYEADYYPHYPSYLRIGAETSFFN
ncbi:MAG TPA: putative porin, partial [Saprospiraceae bacterium]|nr:putative porin [Saprospiraceae bacterium]